MIDAKANIARAKAEREVSRIFQAKLKRAAAVIAAARNIAVSVVGQSATEELLLNEAYALRDDRAHDEMLRSLKGPIE